ncbi:CWC16 protein [Lineolata rhizophorae]|uniref:Splicing factor YJU2 n=1 Tax=Lineolata rhizophorae TaxID=578093 RepID=A0A6A6NYR2_9PEZI|nr:CWC16 protein [Lineolata rhizophorae]
MSERKVLTKYYPPDFDPSKIQRPRSKPGPKRQPVRLMAPFSMMCTSCGEFIYKGRKFNATKETTDETYKSIRIHRFYIRCTRCSAEITFKTDPMRTDYQAEWGCKRNFEPWREAKLAEETEEERLDRLERELGDKDVMQELEAKTHDAKTEMAVADALDEIRTRNARIERADKDGADGAIAMVHDKRDEERERQEREDAEAARKAFARLADVMEEDDGEVADRVVPPPKHDSPAPTSSAAEAPAPTFKRTVKKKKDFGAALGIKKKTSLV